MEELNLVSVCNTLNKYRSTVTYDEDDLQSFLEQDITKETAKNYIDVIMDLNKVIERTKMGKKEKEAASKVFTCIFMKACESECRGELITSLANNNIILKHKVKCIEQDWQKERDEFNKILEEMKKEKKPEKIQIPVLEGSIILKDDKKKLTNKEAVKIFLNSLDENEELSDKFKPIKINNEKVSRAYVKRSEDGTMRITQKGSTSKKI